MRRLMAVAWKEFVQRRRDRMTLGMMVGIPVMQLLLFGYAINTDVRHMPTLVYDQDRSEESRDLWRRLEATGTGSQYQIPCLRGGLQSTCWRCGLV